VGARRKDLVVVDDSALLSTEVNGYRWVAVPSLSKVVIPSAARDLLFDSRFLDAWRLGMTNRDGYTFDETAQGKGQSPLLRACPHEDVILSEERHCLSS